MSQKKIIITGALGFIGSCLVSKLNSIGYTNLVLVDDFSRPGEKFNNIEGKIYLDKVGIFELPVWIKDHSGEIEFIFHIGGNSSTVETNKDIFDRYNTEYTRDLWNLCTALSIPFVYTSSAATYGDGSLGYSDNHDLIPLLKPLNLYGESKALFDTWAIKQENTPPLWAGLKPFNVYGPNEYHKGRMASVIMHFYNQIKDNGQITLFRSHRPEYVDGGQMRDFIYVKDLLDIYVHFLNPNITSGLYNAGTGQARTYLDLARTIFKILNKEENVTFIDTPLDIREKYQYFTEADTKKLREVALYNKKMTSLEDGIEDYIGYLKFHKYL